MILTVIVQSSSAMVGMLQALSVSGAMTFSMVYPIIMGINLGTCVTTAMVCSVGTSKNAKRTGVVHIVFNTIGTILFMVVMSIMESNHVFGAEYWMRTADSGIIANFQTIFNLITAVVLLPFTGVLVKISTTIIKDTKAEAVHHPELHTLDEKLYISPAVAVGEATKAVAAMGDVARINFERGCEQLFSYDPASVPVIDADEDCLDQFADSADHFLIGLSKAVETEADDRQVDMLLQTVPNFERIGDYATNLVELAQRLQDEKTEFSDMAKQELKIMAAAVNDILSVTTTAFITDDNEAAKSIEPLEEVIDDMVMLLRDRHTKRLKNGACSVGSSLVFMEALTYFERASDQCSSIAVMMLARQNDDILANHYEYLRAIHSGNDAAYLEEKERRRKQYIQPLKEIK
jgi:phosphate:Na+ symporter